MKRIFRLLFVVFIFMLSCNQENSSSPDFVTVAGKQFKLNGKPYYFLGANVWYGANLGMEGNKGDRERLISELDLLQSLNVTNLRILGASEGLGKYHQVKPAIQPKLGEIDEDVLRGLDFLLDEMSKRKMHAVIFLNNYWVWSGGMAQYVSWLNGEEVPNPFKEEYSWDQFMRFSGEFYTMEKANEYYRKYIFAIINRKNSINGVLYKNDPTIMSWQLANEPRPQPGEDKEKSVKNLIKWVKETAAYIKSLDPNHLVSTGSEGLAGSLFSEQCYLESNGSENIDFLTFHLWLLNWRWFDPEKPDATYPDAEKKALDYFLKHIQYAGQLGKPITLEEFGIPRDRHSFSPNASVRWRNRYFKKMFDEIYKRAASGSVIAGSNFWAWGGYGKASNPDGEAIWQEGDDFVGDPPQEPQGRNSVFATDETTLKILSEYGNKMSELCK